jgi:SAM-dependent methyltransferase
MFGCAIVGEEYIAAMEAHANDRHLRRAFQDMALQSARPGACIFDFGAGPGVDAKLYAAKGYKVLAYDADPRMCSALCRHCAPEIAAQQLELYQGPYHAFLEQQARQIRGSQNVGLVTADFAPLNLVDDPHALFAALHELTAPGAALLASVLNPNFVGDMHLRWWWKHRWGYWRRGYFCIHGAAGDVFRRSHREFARQAEPYFSLQSVHSVPVISSQVCRGASPLSRFMFLLFARR